MRATILVLVGLVAIAGVGVAAANEAPLADAGLDQQVQQGETVLIDGMGSRDPDGSIARYAWRIESPTGTSVSPTCTDCAWTYFDAASPGTYTVYLTVTDHDGASRTDHLYVRVTPASTPARAPGWGGQGGPPGHREPGTSSAPASDRNGAGSAGSPDGTGPSPVPLSPSPGGTFDFRRPPSIPTSPPSSPSGDLVVRTYPTISPLGGTVGGVSHFIYPNGERRTSSNWVLEVWD